MLNIKKLFNKINIAEKVKIGNDELYRLNEERLKGNNCDFLIKLDNEEKMSAHKHVLDEQMPYFRGICYPTLAEDQTGEVAIKCLSRSVLDKILTFVYTGELDIDCSNVRAVLWWATYFQHEEIVNRCISHIKSEVTLENVLNGCISNKTEYRVLQYMNVCKDFVDKNFSDICHLEWFNELHESVITKILSSTELFVDSEREVFRVIRVWVEYDFNNRSKHMYKLMKCVRLQFLPLDYIKKHVKVFSACVKCSLCCELIKKAINYHKTAPEQRVVDEFPVEMVTQRNYIPTGTIYASFYCKLHKYSMEAAEWEVLDLPENIKSSVRKRYSYEDLGFVFLKDQLYIIQSNNVVKYTPATNKWIICELYSFLQSNCCVHDGQIFTTKNISEDGAADWWLRDRQKIVVYNQIANNWDVVACLNNFRKNCVLVSCCGYIYATGGFSWEERGGVKTVERFDFANNVVEMSASMIEERHCHSAVSIHGKIFVMGGYGVRSHQIKNSCEVFDSTSNQFSLIAPMQVDRARFGIAVYGYEIVCSGGTTKSVEHAGTEILRRSEIYNIIDGTWRQGSCLNETSYGKGDELLCATLFD